MNSTPPQADETTAAPRLLGYCDPLSARPGETISLHVSSPREAFDLEIVRFRGSPVTTEDAREQIDAPGIAGTYDGRLQTHSAGSFVLVEDFPLTSSFDVRLDVFATLLDDEPRGLVSWTLPAPGELSVSADALTLRVGDRALSLDLLLTPRRWHDVRATYDDVSGVGTVQVVSVDEHGVAQVRSAEGALGSAGGLGGEVVIGAARGRGPGGHFNGKLTGPVLSCRDEPLADWDFGHDHASDRVPDRVAGRDGRVLNAPVRAVHGPSWDGSEVDPRLAPQMYDAIHFLEDSLADAGWAPSVSFTVPADWRPGVYAARLTDGTSSDEVPFYVRSPRGAEPPVLFLAPTNTYVAYGNERTSFNENSDALETMKDRPIVPNDDDHYLREHPELGMSIYDTHRDGSGCVYSTRLRPVLAFRADYRSWLTDTQRHFAADLYLIDFLEREGIDYSVAVDEDLDAEGAELLAPHRVVVTGSHPEYHTGAMLDGLQHYVRSGGRLAYLGGNGFYWVTSYAPGARHTIEVRRGFTGDTNFTSTPGEAHHSTTGEPGGIWRLRGRDPRTLAGVGFTAKGWGRARPYRRSDDVPAEWEWVFDGVAADALIGDAGQVLDGAAGDELDCLDPAHGSPANAVRLGVADGFDDMYQPVIEDYTTFVADQGGTVNPRVRADLVAFHTADGGAVFSVGSICWIPSLPAHDFDNPLARLTGNVLRRFGAEGPICPEGENV